MTASPFRGKAAQYEAYRTQYPPDAIAALLTHAALTCREIVADVGAGTGLLTRCLLPHAQLVYAVEPADDMRAAADRALRAHANYRGIPGTAEATTLADRSVDVIACGNSFHYFDPERARREALRILKPGGRVVLLFHDAPRVRRDFTDAYLTFLEEQTPAPLRAVHASDAFDARLATFFGDAPRRLDAGEQTEQLTWETLRGRFLSTSIAPADNDPSRDDVLRALRALFDRFADGETVRYELLWTCMSATIGVVSSPL